MSRKGELIIHVGPPKTATTSLQFFLQGITLKNFIYSGVIQPRGKDPFSLCSLVYKDITSGNDANKDFVLDTVGKNLTSGNNVFLSEECFLLESNNVSWKQKINKISNYFNEFNPSVVVTAREPQKSIISYYHEIYGALDISYKKDYEKFLKSEYCSIYNYEILHDFLVEKFNNIIFMDFIKLIKGMYSVKDFFSKEKICYDIPLLLKKENASSKNNGQYYTKPQTLKSKFEWIFSHLANLSLLKQLSGKGYGRTLLKVVPEIQLGSKKLNINFDSFDYSQFLAGYDRIQKMLR
jgi:hypothetical protein